MIFEQGQLVHKAKVAITEIKEELDHKPGEATRIIKVLNSKTKDELEDRTDVVLEVRKVLTKRNLML